MKIAYIAHPWEDPDSSADHYFELVLIDGGETSHDILNCDELWELQKSHYVSPIKSNQSLGSIFGLEAPAYDSDDSGPPPFPPEDEVDDPIF